MRTHMLRLLTAEYVIEVSCREWHNAMQHNKLYQRSTHR